MYSQRRETARPTPQARAPVMAGARGGSAWFTAGAVLTCILFLTDWPVYSYEVLGGPIPLAYYLVPAIWAGAWLVLRAERPTRLISDPVVLWFAALVLFGAASLLVDAGATEAQYAQFRSYVLSLIILASSVQVIARAEPGPVAKAILLCMVLAAICNWLDFLFPYRFVPFGFIDANPGRGAGFFINANQGANAVVLMTAMVLPMLTPGLRALALVVMAMGVYPTYSRSGILCAGLIIVASIFLGLVRRKRIVWMSLAGTIAVMVAMQLQAIGFESIVDLRNIQDRLSFFSSAGAVVDESAIEREYMIRLATQMFLEHPIIGNGLGSSLVEGGGRGMHNMYMLFAAEQGLMGLLLFVALLALMFVPAFRLYSSARNRRTKDVGAGLLVFSGTFAFLSLFSHTILGDAYSLILVAATLVMKSRALAGE